MIDKTFAKRLEEDRCNGFSIFSVQEKPLRLGHLLAFVQDVFPNHSLDQLVITEADDGQFVVSTEDGKETRVN